MRNFKSESPCQACGYYEEDSVCYHHIMSQKAFPEYKYAIHNLMPLCREHHNEVHNTGLNDFAQKYSRVKFFLDSNGYEYNHFLGKWNHIERR